MKYRVIIQPAAAAEIDEAYLWVVEHAPESATKWFHGLEAGIQTLDSFPQRCPLAEESKAFDVEIRQLIYGQRVGAYRILFTIVEDAVHVLHVRHGRRKRIRPGDRPEMRVSQVEYASRVSGMDSQQILTFYMGKNTPERKDYIMENLVVAVEE